jgi:polyferredoxin/Pyruvate/2-oxoacid:ferredoxin oxidoreductase delta subunit
MAHGASTGGRRGSGGWQAARWVRRAVQTASFLLFVYLLFAGLQRLAPRSYANIFFRFDPLAGLATMLAARAWLEPFALALVTLAAALLLGRVWCGWICPLGTLLGWLRFRSARRLGARMPDGLRRVKYVLLGAIVVLAALQNLTLLALDPLALLTRTVTTSVIPGFVFAAGTLETLGMSWGPTTGVVSWVEQHFRGSVLPTTQPRYEQGVALFLVLLAVILLGVLADRFWCRYLCPLGALLGLVSKVQVLRPLAAGGCCGSCGACAGACRQDAILTSAAGARVVTSECTMCLDCLVACPKPGGMSVAVGRPGPWAAYDPGRRDAVVALGAGVGAALLLGTGIARAVKGPGLVRPPGAQDERVFLSRCLRCSECMKACPTSGLQPTLLEAGVEGIWTPVLRSRLGCCDYSCTACGHICPSGAIPRLDLEEKRRQVLGLAVIDRDRCLPWASDTPCIVCQEMCPVPDKAIVLQSRHLITRPDGSKDYLSRPVVVADRCIGCGICEYKCPLEGPAAIRVRPSNPSLHSGAGPPAAG